MSAKERLIAHLNSVSDQPVTAEQVAQDIEDMIVAAVEAHRETEPHLYADGSRA